MENEGMSQVTKVLLLFGAVMAVGFIIVGTSRETPEEKKLQAASLQSSMLNKLAVEKCSDAIYEHTKERIYTPTETSSDNNSYVQLAWRAGGKVKDAECRYEAGNGIALLKVNGETINTKTIGETPSANPTRSSTAAGGHGSPASGGGH